jgi:hypothetical protein
MPAPTDLTGYQNCVGENFTFTVTGSTASTWIWWMRGWWWPVWGTDNYTDDSNLAIAAVHAGVVQNSQTKNITVTILPGQNSYTGSMRNGVTSSSYGYWCCSFSFN